jgi:hypothetical protein
VRIVFDVEYPDPIATQLLAEAGVRVNAYDALEGAHP